MLIKPAWQRQTDEGKKSWYTMGQNTLLFNVVCNKTPPSLTSHACFMQRWEGKQWRINCCSILQQQLDTFQATSCTGITKWSASINVTSIHLLGHRAKTVTHWWRHSSTWLDSLFCSNTNSTISPVRQHPAAVWHTESVPVYTLHAAGWWSPQPQCWLLHLPRSVAAAGELCLGQRPRAQLTGLSRIQDHELQIREAKQRLSLSMCDVQGISVFTYN